MKFPQIGCAFALAFLTVACSKPTVVGKWKVDPAMATPAGLPAGFMTGFASTFKYEFKPDNTFTGAMSGGTYTLDGNKLVMTTTTVAGQDISKLGGNAAKTQMTGELASDGQSMVLHPPVGTGSLSGLSNIKMVPDK